MRVVGKYLELPGKRLEPAQERNILFWLQRRLQGEQFPTLTIRGQRINLLLQALRGFNSSLRGGILGSCNYRGCSGDRSINARRNFWIRQLVLILSHEIEVPGIRQVLERLFPNVIREINITLEGGAVPWAQIDWTNNDQVALARLGLLELFSSSLLRQPNNQHPYALMESETYFQQARLQRGLGNEETAAQRLQQARDTIYGRLVPRVSSEGQFEEFDVNAARQYLPGIVRNSGQPVINLHLAYASVQMARILMMEATNLQEEIGTTSNKEIAIRLNQQRLERLEQAQLYLCRAIGNLSGMDQLEAREMLGRSFAEIGETRITLGQSGAEDFRAAATHLDAVIEIGNRYREQLAANNGVEPRRFAQIYTSARIARERLNMAAAESLFQTAEETTETASWQRRLGILAQAEAGLTTAIDEQYVYHVEGQEIRVPLLTGQYLLQVRLDRAICVSQQAVIRGWLGETDTASGLRERARVELQAILAVDSSANPLIRAEAQRWLDVLDVPADNN